MKRTCDDCKYADLSATEEPCSSCDGPDCRFKPKEEGMTNDNQAELENAKLENAQHMKTIETLRKELARACGTIEGLKFALRCNGVSGGEV